VEPASSPERGVDATVEADDEHASLRGAAPDKGHAELARRVLEHRPDTTAKPEGQTPLHVVADEREAELARLSLERGPDATGKADDVRDSLDIVLQRPNEQVACVLLDHGARTTAQNDQRCCHCIPQ
jgi:ankyrin repeat protein